MWFFFSSRRRHTRCGRDWSSDVCSSDLLVRVRTGVASAGIWWGMVSPFRGLGAWGEEDGHTRVGVAVVVGVVVGVFAVPPIIKIGRASCRERVERWVGRGAWSGV